MNGAEVRVIVARSEDGGRTWRETSRDDTGWPTGTDATIVRAWIEHAAAAVRLSMLKAAMITADPEDDVSPTTVGAPTTVGPDEP